MKSSDELLHDLNDRLNGIMISVELALRLHERQDSREVGQILARMRDDCVACTSLVADLRDPDDAAGSAKDRG